ncbi:hypothetical protein H2248_000749 [Termitomyces sp. 'cryptogamus']|nr:hypothetical protein H2248_000749 [Termitomyces sp. 'cryptogamus']
MGWQKTFNLLERAKGCHLVTKEILAEIGSGLEGVQAGMLFLFMLAKLIVYGRKLFCDVIDSSRKHTSAALTVNENYDRDVRTDMDMALDVIVPESLDWRHTDEGSDDSVSHTKASLIGSSISIPITNGKLNLGTWQGIYLTEFRHRSHSRTIVATIIS